MSSFDGGDQGWAIRRFENHPMKSCCTHLPGMKPVVLTDDQLAEFRVLLPPQMAGAKRKEAMKTLQP